MANKTLKVVVSLVVTHWILYTLLKINQSMDAYAMGQSIGKLFWVIIIAFVLIRVVKYGWVISIFVMAITLARESTALIQTLEIAGPSDNLATPWILFSIVNMPLIVALALMLRTDSQKPFIELRNPDTKNKDAP